MGNLEQFLDMGGHGGFIWASYGMVLVVMVVLWIVSRRYVRTSQDELNKMDVERPHRRQGQSDET